MKILWFTWKDRKHPLAGGAETFNEEIAKRLAKDGHKSSFGSWVSMMQQRGEYLEPVRV